MGKKRIKTIDLSKEEEKKVKKKGRVIVKSGKQHGRIVDMGAIMLEEMEQRKEAKKDKKPVTAKAQKEQRREKKVARPLKARSQRYQKIKKLIKPDKLYPLSEAIELLKKMANAQFDETVELHLVPSAHLKVGKVSWPKKKLEEKIQDLLKSTGVNKIKKAVLTSTMSPGIKIDFE